MTAPWLTGSTAGAPLKRLKHNTYIKARVGWHGLSSDEHQDSGPHLVTGTDFKDGVVDWETSTHVSWSRWAQDPYIQLREDDLLVTKDGTIGKVALVKELPGQATLNSGVFVLRPEAGEYRARYLYWVLNSRLFTEFIRFVSRGSTINHLYQRQINEFAFPVWRFERQRAIADFLDRKTAAIDALIETKRRLLDLLAEKRTALINRAVTKGLDPNVPMKDSGIPWIGEIPVHWDVVLLRLLARLESGHTPSRSNPEYWVPEECTVPWFTLADVWQLRSGRQVHLGATKERISALGMANSAARLLPTGTVVLSRTASVGFSGIMPVPMATTQDFANWVCGPKLAPEFLNMAFRGMRTEFQRIMMGSTHQTIYMPDIRQLRLPVPPLAEQERIAKEALRLTEGVDMLADTIRRQVARLQEYRQALITAAVTGQVDIIEADDEEAA